MEMSTQSHLTYPMEQGRPPSDILCSTDISRKTMGGGMGGIPPHSSRSGKGSRIGVIVVVVVVVIPVVVVVVLTA